MSMTFTESELLTIDCALSIAAVAHEEEAMRQAADHHHAQAARSDKWARDCRKLAYDIGNRPRAASPATPHLTQDNMGHEFTCTACGRVEEDCSAEPCAAVIADRES